MESKNETGRSMVEMLGVLAVIGVLSAGALKGYSAAMFKYKMNQTIETYNQVLQRFIELEQKGWGKNVTIGEDGNGTPIDIVKYGLLPDCQITENNKCKLPIGALWMNFEDKGSYVYGVFEVSFTDSKSCIAFASAGWENASPVEWWNNIGNIYGGGGFIRAGSKDIYVPLLNITEVKMSDIIEGCRICETSLDQCTFYHVIREDI